MPLTHIRIENFKSIKRCDIETNDLNVFIGANGSGKTNILHALIYYYNNLTEHHIDNNIFDANNRFSNQVKITLTFDLLNFYKISKSNNYNLSEKSGLKSYYKSIISFASSQENKTFSLEMLQIKGIGIKWNEPFEKRRLIKSLFPFFYLNARELDLKEWSQVWNVLGELGNVSNPRRRLIERQIHEIIEKDTKISNKIHSIQSIFESSELSIQPYTSKDFAKALAKIYYSGEIIYQKGRNLNYYSTGTNSVKYIELLLRAINEIAKNKIKEPVILFDEPEISLHPNYIDELAETLSLVNNKLRIILSTHSPRLTKNLMSNTKKMFLYNITIDGKYSSATLMKRFAQYSPESKYRVTDDHISSYFSKGILFVEGETELELFSNPLLHVLFPQLKNIDIFKAMSQEPILNIMNPKKTKSKIPYISLIDADKAINFNVETKKFILQNTFFHETKERFLYRNKKVTTTYLYHLRQRIDNMSQKLHIHYFKPFYSCKDTNYTEFIDAVHKYLFNYSVFTLSTTIEGTLINNQTFSYAMEFLKQRNKFQDYSNFETYINSQMKIDKLNILRLVYNGKSDLLKKYDKNLKKELSDDVCLILDRVMIGKKTSGWISDYIENFFKKILHEEIEKTPREMVRFFDENNESKNIVRSVFRNYFKELFDLFMKINDLTG